MIRAINTTTQSNFLNIIIKKSAKNKHISSSLPIVATPIVAYSFISDAKKRNTSIQIEAVKTNTLHSSNHPVTDNTEINKKALKKLGIKNQDIPKYLDKNGNINDTKIKSELKTNGIAHKGAPQDALESDYGFESGEIESPEIHDIDILADTELSDSLDQLAEIADNPVLEGVVAEMLPGTRFLKPGKDFIEGDCEKAA